MAQFARPDSNITQTSFTGGFAEIDESSASDADFAYGANNTAAVLEVGLTNPTDPNSSSSHTFRYRIAKTNAGTVDGGGNAVTVTAALFQGTTQIATDAAQTANGTWTQYEFTLSGAEADSITDYTDLRLRFTTSASGGSPANRRGGAVSWAELQVPDVSSPQVVNPGFGELVFTGFEPTVATTNHKLVQTDVGTITVNGFSPSLDSGINTGVGQLSVEGFSPTVVVGVNIDVQTGQVDVTGFAPTVITPVSVTTDLGQLILEGFAPTVSLPISILAQLGQLTLEGFAPTIDIQATGTTANTDTGVLTFNGFAPSLDSRINLQTGILTADGFAPSVVIGSNIVVMPDSGSLVFTGFAPSAGSSITVLPNGAEMSFNGFPPQVTISGSGSGGFVTKLVTFVVNSI